MQFVKHLATKNHFGTGTKNALYQANSLGEFRQKEPKTRAITIYVAIASG